MKSEHWKDSEKFEVVLSGLRGQMTVAELCAEYEIHQSQYYKWKERFLREGPKLFSESQGQTRDQLLEKKIARMERALVN